MTATAALGLAAMLIAQHPPPDAAAPPAPPTSAPQPAYNACVACHENLAGRLGEIVLLEWKRSVHYAHQVTCDGCHGGDATMRPEQFDTPDAFKRAAHLQRDAKFLTLARSGEFVSRARGREVSYFCGKCHAVIKEKHLGSPHGDNGDPTCLFCHARTPQGTGTHAIPPATLDIIDTRGRAEGGNCSACHQAATMQAVAQIRQTLDKTAGLIEQASIQYHDLQQRGYRSLELAGLQEHGREVLSRLRQVFHSFNMQEINNYAGEIQALAERTARTHTLLEQVTVMRHRQTIVGLGVCAFLFSFVALLLFYKKRFCIEHGALSDLAKPHA